MMCAEISTGITLAMETIDAKELIDSLGIAYFTELSTFGALSEEVICDMLENGKIERIHKGEYINHEGEQAEDFQVVLQGRIAYYKHCEGHDVLTRHFCRGEQLGFDEMIGLIERSGTDVAAEDSTVLSISSTQFYELHLRYPTQFGVFMLNLARELSREIALLEDVIGKGTGWIAETGT